MIGLAYGSNAPALNRAGAFLFFSDSETQPLQSISCLWDQFDTTNRTINSLTKHRASDTLVLSNFLGWQEMGSMHPRMVASGHRLEGYQPNFKEMTYEQRKYV